MYTILYSDYENNVKVFYTYYCSSPQEAVEEFSFSRIEHEFVISCNRTEYW